jgi:hypothetical protein
VLRRGDRPERFYIVRDGSAALREPGQAAGQARKVGAGGYFGEGALRRWGGGGGGGWGRVQGLLGCWAALRPCLPACLPGLGGGGQLVPGP